MKSILLILKTLFYFFLAEVPLERIKRQDLDEDALEKQLCSDKGAGEWFRLETGQDKCRDVIQCTSSVSVFSVWAWG